MCVKLFNGDCLEVMKEIPDRSVDVILTDPPYFNIVKMSWDKQWKNMSDYQNWCEKIAKEFKRILKDNGSIIWFGDDKNIAYCQVIFDKYFNLLNNLVWYKKNYFTKKFNHGFRMFAPMTERILFYEKYESEKEYNNRDEQQKQNIYKECIEYMMNEKRKIRKDFEYSDEEFNSIVDKITGTKNVGIIFHILNGFFQ